MTDDDQKKWTVTGKHLRYGDALRVLHFLDDNEHKALREAIRAAQDLITARSLIEILVDPEDCRYDHNDFCQAHYDGRPCVHELAKAFLDGDSIDPTLSR